MKLLVSLLLVISLSVGAENTQPRTLYSQGQLQFGERVAYLARLKKEKKYDELMFALFPDVRKGGMIPRLNKEEDEQDFFWLRSETAVPPPNDVDFPLYYFLSWKLAFADVSSSRYMNALGRIRLMLDANLCIKNSRFSTPWNVLVEGGAFNNMQLREGKEWLQAVDYALNWHGKAIMVFDKKEWYCGPNNAIPSSEVADRYRETLRKIRESNSEKLRQYDPQPIVPGDAAR